MRLSDLFVYLYKTLVIHNMPSTDTIAASLPFRAGAQLAHVGRRICIQLLIIGLLAIPEALAI